MLACEIEVRHLLTPTLTGFATRTLVGLKGNLPHYVPRHKKFFKAKLVWTFIHVTTPSIWDSFFFLLDCKYWHAYSKPHTHYSF